MANKGTEQFKEVIKRYLDNYAERDELFRVRYASTQRTIDDVVTYILNEVQKSGCCGFADEEIFSMALHVIDEPDIEIGNPINDCKVVVNHHVELTEEEKEEQRAIALKRYQEEELSNFRKRNSKTNQTSHTKVQQASLFDF